MTVCSADKAPKESTPEACTDGIDNDGDGYTDCSDWVSGGCNGRQICGGSGTGPFVTTSGMEEATNASCSNGLDDDLDGKVDCNDTECQYNPFVSVCGGLERTLDTCFDGIDNDGDGYVDCNDRGCAWNPYVLRCNPQSPFLKESTVATCSDGIDNDQDHYVDCNDFGCKNSQFGSDACGSFENTLYECTDGRDNDDDSRIDCADDNCAQNPFFGQLICADKPKNHVQTVEAGEVYNGVYRESDASLVTEGSAGGAAGWAGAEKGVSIQVHISYFPCEVGEEPCESWENRWCAVRTLTGGGTAEPPTGGTAADPAPKGNVSVGFTGRRSVDLLRTLLSPRQWMVGAAQGNALFKRASKPEVEEAAFLYLHDIMRLKGVLAEVDLECPKTPSSLAGLPMYKVLLLSAACPVLGRNAIHLAYLRSGMNFYGISETPVLNPHERYAVQYEAIQSVYQDLQHASSKWINLANGLDGSTALQLEAESFRDTANTLSASIDVATARERAALDLVHAVDEKLSARKLAIQNIRDQIDTNNEAIKAKYATSGLGGLILDLGAAYLSSFGGDLLKEAGAALGEQVLGDLGQLFKSEKPGGVGGPPSTRSDAEVAMGKVWDQVVKSASDAVKEEPVKDAANALVADIPSLLAGTPTGAARSVVVDEVANEVLKATQLQVTLDYMDLIIDKRKAEQEYAISQMERQLEELRQTTALASAARIDDYLQHGAELTPYDRVLLGQSVYSNAIMLVEQFTQRYWKLLRQAQYEFLPFADDGKSELHELLAGKYDITLLNYPDFGAALTRVHEDVSNRLRGSKNVFYRRVPQNELVVASDSDMARFKAIGLDKVPPFDTGVVPHVLHMRINHSDVVAHPFLRSRRNVRIDDARVNFLSSSQGNRPTVFLVRDGLDGFRVRRIDGKDHIADFEIAKKDLSSSRSVRSPLQYQSIQSCSSLVPGCDLASPECRTSFQQRPDDDYSCGLFGVAPGSTPWLQNTFYDRSLVGDWTVVVAADVLPSMGTISGVEIGFLVSSLDL